MNEDITDAFDAVRSTVYHLIAVHPKWRKRDIEYLDVYLDQIRDVLIKKVDKRVKQLSVSDLTT